MFMIENEGRLEYSGPTLDLSFKLVSPQLAGTVEPLLYDHPQNHIGVVV